MNLLGVHNAHVVLCFIYMFTYCTIALLNKTFEFCTIALNNNTLLAFVELKQVIIVDILMGIVPEYFNTE